MLKEPTDCSWMGVKQQLAGHGKTLSARWSFTGLHVWEVRGVQHPGCSKRLSSKAAGEQEPEAYPLGYVEDSCELRTKLGAFFSILLGYNRCELQEILARQEGVLL